MLAALCVDGILHLAIQPFAYKADSFNQFVSDLLLVMNPFPGPNSVLVIDNAPIHKAWELREMVEARKLLKGVPSALPSPLFTRLESD
ncbi:hypothetical protein FS749_007639 [Ceratobasidium sp. UAMH 11750]|nr:hypothetical protein FS749_007639 [Ceratobasidium sp. UAMH 11750]